MTPDTMTKLKSLCLREHDVRALLRCGRVLVVRLVKPQPIALSLDDYRPGNEWARFADNMHARLHNASIECPFGGVGERMVGKEPWARRDDFDWKAEKSKTLHYLHYKASYDGDLGDEWHNYGKWRSASTMPEWCSRLTVEVSAVQCKRIQSITEDEAKAAGIEGNAEGQWKHYLKPKYGPSPIHSFETLWRSLHGPDAWASNPFVWFGDLRRVE